MSLRLLLDTYALLWIEYGDPRLGDQTKQAIQAAAGGGAAFVCPITFWEIGLLAAKGRFSLGVSLSAFRQIVLQGGYVERPVDSNDVVAMATLPKFHADPADCLLVATARNAGLTLVTSDRKNFGLAGLAEPDGQPHVSADPKACPRSIDTFGPLPTWQPATVWE